ncbi:MAG TPA: hypothetical protein VJ986_14245 [Gaiellaceae bacterium]|nr:hypothetical protein [Gaiellaceae bacterium]
MLGVAALLAAFSAALAQPPVGGVRPLTTFAVLPASHVRIVVLPAARLTKLHSCSVQRSRPNGVERKVLPVACEQPPRSSVNVPNGATGGISPLLGG